jgi:hypothetical protein
MSNNLKGGFMKKVFSFFAVALILMAGLAFADSDSLITGSVNQESAAITLPTWHNATDMFGSAGASGSQLGSASFYAHPVSPSGEGSIGNAGSDGQAIVNAGVTHIDGTSITSFANGSVSNNGYVNISETGALVPTTTNTLNGTGTLNLGTFASIGAGSDGQGIITNGGFATGQVNGLFNYNATGGQGWIGNGGLTGDSFSNVTKLLNGYQAIAGAHITATVCPK